jgi:hypothetical protein
LRAEIAYVHRFAVFVDAGRAGDQKHHQAVQVDPHAARKRTGPIVIVGLVEHAQVGDGPFLNGRAADLHRTFLRVTF